MANENYILLERTELNASAASVVFANIPQTGYTDLKIVCSARTDRSAAGSDWIKISFNGVTTNLSMRSLYGSGSTAGSYTDTGIYSSTNSNSQTATTFGNTEFYIPNYTGNTNKSVSADGVSETNASTNNDMTLVAGLWSSTAAITSVTLAPYTGPNFLANSTFSLYGIAALGTTPVIAPKASGGNRIDNDGTYWYHTFTSSGTFTPQVGLTADVLVVAGGGSGGIDNVNVGAGAGGGAGEIRYLAGASLGVSSVAITVGGGAASVSGVSQGNKGSNSVVTGLATATGGGGGGAYLAGTGDGAAGGSGGGGSTGNQAGGAAGTGGSGGIGYSNAGGTGAAFASPYGAGGGGGSGAQGVAGSGGGANGNGGAGLNTWSSWASATSTGVSGFYAGGGGSISNANAASSLGGSGGGGQKGSLPGVTNTGSGGSGEARSGTGASGSGGSGIILIRYPIA
jgi:hypothetical protein